jgi:beta-glucosidase
MKPAPFAALLVSMLSACSTLEAPAARTAPAVVASSTANPGNWPKLSPPLPRDAALEARVQELVARMSVEQKVGQVIQGDIGSTTPEDVRKYHLGSVLAGGNSDPGGKYNAPATDWLKLADDMHAASMDTRDGRVAIPVLLGIDAVHGHNNVVGATLFPHNIGLGAANDPELVRKIAAATALELRATGFEWTFAPTVTVPRDDRWGRTYEGYSEDPELVARYATAVVEGLQGSAREPGFLDHTRVAASSKHFIGDGGTFEGKDKGDTRVSEAELRDVHGAGHLAALAAGTQTVMASFSSWNGQKMHGNRSLLTDVLKARLGFDGFVVGDWNGHGEVAGCTNENCAASLVAGVDMYMAPDSWRALYANTLAQVRSGEIPMERLDDAVSRILRVKLRMGLFEAGLPSKRSVGGRFDLLGADAHRDLAREAVRKSLVLLKNDRGVLPLDPRASVLVAGNGADDIGKQSGGWTLSWQGTGNKPTDFPNAESIWQGIRSAVTSAGGQARLDVAGRYANKPDVAIVVFGEDPYAEFIGDIPNLAYQPGNATDLALLRRLRAEGIPVVSVFLSGRPLWVNREINASDAFVAAWLPGSEGGGVADVLFKDPQGRIVHDFTGTLPFSWPRTASQPPQNVGATGYDPQFKPGHGLAYARPAALGALPEESGLAHDDAPPGVYFAAGKVAAGWSLRIGDAGGAVEVVRTLPVDTRGLAVTAADHLAQEDARRLRWDGSVPARAWLQSDAPIDLSREAMSGAMLVVTMRLDRVPAAGFALRLSCGADCGGNVAIDTSIAPLPRGTWFTVGVPLQCFKTAGTDLARVERIFGVESSADAELAFSSVVLGDKADVRIGCTTP